MAAFPQFSADSLLFDCERLIENKKLAEYYKTWGFRMIEDDSYNDKLNEEWQSDYSQNCIFMYKPIAEIV